ncbi:MAG: transcription elongation factor GreB, partial [Nevskia sp.]|nr:transcription elongation factor GreB [Nevskia sp.]
EDEAGETKVYRIVGGDETDARGGWISVDSPLARVLLKKQAGEAVTAQLPGGEVHLSIVSVRYQP